MQHVHGAEKDENNVHDVDDEKSRDLHDGR